MSGSDLNFHIGDKVVYPNHGVGVIEQISSRSVGATVEKFSDSTSTIFPLPSSPHWAPTITAVLPFFNCSSVRGNLEQADGCAAPGVAHSLPAGKYLHKNYWDKSGEDVYGLSYRVHTANSNARPAKGSTT